MEELKRARERTELIQENELSLSWELCEVGNYVKLGTIVKYIYPPSQKLGSIGFLKKENLRFKRAANGL